MLPQAKPPLLYRTNEIWKLLMPEIICTKEAESGQKGCNNDSAAGQHAVGGAVTLTEERERRDQQEGNYKKAKVTGVPFWVTQATVPS